MPSTIMSNELMEWVKHQGTPEELRKLIGLFRNLADTHEKPGMRRD